MSEVIAEAADVPIGRIAALSGPNLAAEVARNLPASAVVAAADLDLAERVAARLARRRFRLYVNEDILGVELCGALKNVVAIAAGAADGLGFGDNGKAGLLTRGLAEMTRLGIAAGANPLTFAGLAGMGDLIATCGLAPVAQPPPRRGAREGPHVGRDRGDAARDGRGRLHGPGRAGPGRAPRRRDADRPRGRTAPCSRARASSAAWSTCWPASRRTSWPTTAAGVARVEARPATLADGLGAVHGRPGARLRVRRGVAQSGSAPVWGTGGRGFKSRRPDQHLSVRAESTTRSSRPRGVGPAAVERLATDPLGSSLDQAASAGELTLLSAAPGSSFGRSRITRRACGRRSGHSIGLTRPSGQVSSWYNAGMASPAAIGTVQRRFVNPPHAVSTTAKTSRTGYTIGTIGRGGASAFVVMNV